MLKYFSELNPVIIIVAIIIALLLLGLYFYRKSRKLAIVSQVGESKEPNTEGKYPCYIWGEDGIRFEKIDKKIGNVFLADPTLPHSGPCFLCKEDKDGEETKLTAYDPRVSLMKEGQSPQDCYEAVVWPEVASVYVDFSSLWEKFKALLPYLILGGEVLILLVVVDRLAGGG